MRKVILAMAAVCLLARAVPGAAGETDPQEKRYRILREKMVSDQIEKAPWRETVKDKRVLEAMRTTPRHRFVPPSQAARAYGDHPLPIGYGQTISQPYMVAYMTEILEPKATDKVLEIGTGSAYQAAVLSPLVKEVRTIEIVRPLGEAAKKRLAALGYRNVHVGLGDGYYGWPEHGPYDAIIVTCAATHVPPPLLKQLKKDGRMCIPVGSMLGGQQLLLVQKEKDGKVVTKSVMGVRFVPLTGGHRDPDK